MTAQEPLPGYPRRIVVAGTSGSGKTTLAARLSELLRLPQMEIEDLFRYREWFPRPLLEDDVPGSVTERAWVTEWQFSQARALVAAGADLVVWLDFGRWRVTGQVAGRALRRGRGGRSEAEAKVEPPVWAQPPDRQHLLRWARSTHLKSAERITALLQQRPDLPVVRLPTRADVERWVAGPLREAAARRGDDPA